jgi:hypothetical protein
MMLGGSARKSMRVYERLRKQHVLAIGWIDGIDAIVAVRIDKKRNIAIIATRDWWMRVAYLQVTAAASPGRRSPAVHLPLGIPSCCVSCPAQPRSSLL